MANVTFSYNPTPAPACYPSDVNGLAALLTSGGMLSGTIPDTAGGGVYVGSSAPSSALTNKVWFKTDAAGRPLGVFLFYNGNWRKMYTGVGYGELRMYVGSNTVFDGTGRGVIGGDFDGWVLCNGNNGTPNLEAYFVVGGVWGTQVGQGAGWFSDTDGQVWRNTGGSKGPHMIGRTNLPKLEAEVHSRVGNAAAGTDGFGIGNTTDPNIYYTRVTDSAGNPVDGAGQQPMSLPLFYAVAYMMFVGYQ
jgi:hypothetical protein